MKQNLTQKMISILGREAGNRIPLKDFFKSLEPKISDAKSIGRRTRKFFSRETDTGEAAIILAELELLGLVSIQSNRLSIKEPFLLRAKISLSPKGIIFAVPKDANAGARDVFIRHSESKDCLPGDEVLIRITDRSRDRFEGKIVQIQKKARSEFRMKILDISGKGGIPGLILDTPGNLAAILYAKNIPADTVKRFRNESVVIVSLTGESINYLGSHFRLASFLRFENDTDMDPDYSRVLMKYNLNPVYPAVELPDPDEEISAASVRDWKKRHDLRHLYTVTIDGDDSKDFDDAISLEYINAKNCRLYVHIADVSHYVKKDTALDEEAKSRATSVYLVNRVVPMLPPVLSENLCSLVAGKTRLAFTAEMELNIKTGKIIKSDFYKSIILVDHRYTYNNAERDLDLTINTGNSQGDISGSVRGRISDEEFTPDHQHRIKLIADMWNIASNMRSHRIENGKIDLDIPEPVIKLDENDKVKEINFRNRLKSSVLIEEFMLTANQAVARFLTKKKARTLYRVHEEMEISKVERLNEFFKIYNVPCQLKNSEQKQVIKAMDTVNSHPAGKGLKRVFNMILLRSFMQAVYRPEPLGHWGLAFDDYCHFTSPIRRYPDLIVHRALEKIIYKEKEMYSPEEMTELGRHTSEMERKAMEAERDMQRLKVLQHIQKSGQTKFKAFITGFKPDRVFLELRDFPAEGIVTANHLTNDMALILPDSFSFYIKKLSRPAFLGEEWEVELERADLEEIKLYFKPIWPAGKHKGMQLGS
jgi:ribonuclease R